MTLGYYSPCQRNNPNASHGDTTMNTMTTTTATTALTPDEMNLTIPELRRLRLATRGPKVSAIEARIAQLMTPKGSLMLQRCQAQGGLYR